VTFAFVTFQVLTDNLPSVTARLGSAADDAATNLTWLSWVVPLAVYEVILQGRRLFGAGMNSLRKKTHLLQSQPRKRWINRQ
jgi:hypothetical protein